MRHAPVPQASFDLLHLAARGLAVAATASTAGERYAEAHLASLRAASAVLAARAQPARVRRGPSSVWSLLPEVAPELGEWSAFFAAGAGKRAAAEAGLPVVSTREADDLLRDSATFLALVETTLGLDHQVALPLTG
ncbi:MAG TPA: SAV_6107 family HEPN domain-containing protein [Ornithinibacter sp.]|nr:SAV_6107 family HEPN domain-containing protein [Ornithinibacter sp.]